MKQEKYTTEELKADEQRVASMLGALTRVEAPADFDLRLKGRIARGAPSSASMIAPWLRYAALTVLLLGFAGFLAFNGMFMLDSGGVPEVTESRFQPVAVPSVEPTIQIAEAPREIARDEIVTTPVEAASQTTAVRRTRRDTDARQSNSGSFDIGLGTANTVLQPRGFPVVQPTPPPNQRPDGLQDGGISVKEILSSLGIAADKSSDGWSVKSIAAKSQAERSGVQAADVIEAIGNHAVKGKDSLTGSVSIDSITVVRGGKRIVIKLAGR